MIILLLLDVQMTLCRHVHESGCHGPRKVALEKPGGNRRGNTGRWLVARNGDPLRVTTSRNQKNKYEVDCDENQSQNGRGVALRDAGKLKH